jgi:hypothetical protein
MLLLELSKLLARREPALTAALKLGAADVFFVSTVR